MCRVALLFEICCGNVIASMLVTSEMINFRGIGLGGDAKCQADAGAVCGTLITGKEPISCSSKHSSAAGLDSTVPSSVVSEPSDGNETVAEYCWLGSSRAFLLEESTAKACDFGGEFLRPISELILSCQLAGAGS
jgi:hypothetical protein